MIQPTVVNPKPSKKEKSIVHSLQMAVHSMSLDNLLAQCILELYDAMYKYFFERRSLQ